jgi:hypothetical protein
MNLNVYHALLTAVLIATVASAKSNEVIDLGSLKVEGAARGPEINVIEMGMDGDTSGRILYREIKKMERHLLESKLPRSNAKQGVRR